MKTINISVSDTEFEKFGLKLNMSFSEIFELVSKDLAKKKLDESVRLAEKYGLSDMTLDEINEEIKAIRNAKNNN